MSGVVTEAVRGLAMAGATLEVRVGPADLSETGADRVDFRIETNPGEGWGEVADVASGGELSRITLALFSALSATVGTPVMVYDEIDAGVSGAVADRMGEVLAQAARARQVLVVTHHGQVAARAAAHFRIGKQTIDGRTAASLDRLDEAGRVDETARMLGGRTVTETVLAHARELLLPL
jgi:DNA repair protein RecN (Recombination protein N)